MKTRFLVVLLTSVIVIVALSTYWALKLARQQLTESAGAAYEAGHDKVALRLFGLAELFPGKANPEFGYAHILLMRDALGGHSNSSEQALSVLAPLDLRIAFLGREPSGRRPQSAMAFTGMNSAYDFLRATVGLYQQSALMARGDSVAAKAVIVKVCGVQQDEQLRACARMLIKNLKERSLGALAFETRDNIETFFLFSRTQYAWTRDPVFLGDMLDGLGYIDFSKAVALKEEKARIKELGTAGYQEYCEMVGELVTRVHRFEQPAAQVAKEAAACHSRWGDLSYTLYLDSLKSEAVSPAR